MVTVAYQMSPITNEWTTVFWACYKNLMIVACLYFLYNRSKILHTDKIFIGGAIITNIIQSLMYTLCPISTDEQKVWYFGKYAWFVALVAVVCIILYLNELFYGDGA